MVVIEARSADEWQEVVSNCFVPLLCQASAESYSARMQHASVGPAVSVSLLETEGTRVQRTARLAARAQSDDLHMSFQLGSTGRVSQGGRSVAVRPGSLTVYATDLPYEQDYSRSAQHQLIIQVSRRALSLPRRMIDDACRRMAVPALPAGRVLQSFASRIVAAEEEGSPAVAAAAADLAATLVRSSFATGTVVPRTSIGLLETVRDCVRHNFTLPDLTVDSLAARHFISRRRLYQLFDEVGESPSEWIRVCRLEHAAGLLAEAGRMAKHTIGEIAQMSGFSDAATFARAFRRKYGMNPSDYRSPGRSRTKAPAPWRADPASCTKRQVPLSGRS
ncbi:AraC family transcriptional regulator [Microbacterium sp. BWT-B31]|uniref:AraC family transcriptional regulator n=1 Tax=Microbacterium sp. BWT-B31 TaxID=3232072 RepID=UPI0035284698